MTLQTAEVYLKQLSVRAEEFKKAVSGVSDLLYTVNCVCAYYDGGSSIITITAPLNWQKGFTDFGQAFEAFSQMVKKLAADDKNGGGLTDNGQSFMEYLFELPEDEMAEILDGWLEGVQSGTQGQTKGLCHYQNMPHGMCAHNIVNFTVNYATDSAKYDIVSYAKDIMAKSFVNFDL